MEPLGQENQIYSQMILDYYKNPINFGKPKNKSKIDLEAHGGNVSCGDTLDLYLTFDKTKKVIKEAKFEGSGCAISRAGGCIITELIKEKNVDEVIDMNPKEVTDEMGGIIQTRIKCALLGLNVTKKALIEWKKNPKKNLIVKRINV